MCEGRSGFLAHRMNRSRNGSHVQGADIGNDKNTIVIVGRRNVQKVSKEAFSS